jgi:hypothetical protein
MDSWEFPPWSPAADETVALDLSTFRNCEAAVQAVASRGNGQISDELYTVSSEWGEILRAKVTFVLQDLPTTSLVTCWSAAEPHVQMFVKIDDGER